jgi:hypothetical protein
LGLALSALLIACGGEEEPGAQGAGTATREQAPAKATERGVPLQPGGDNSIARYGAEAPAAEREAIEPRIETFVNERARRRWPAVCSRLSAALKAELRRFVAGSKKLAGASCATILAALNPKPNPFVRDQAGEIELLSLRAKGPQAFAIYRAANETVLYLPLRREGGRWSVGSVDAAPLVG